jgi:hypothetical protein
MRENLWRMLVRKARSHWFKTENDRRENEMIKSSERELGGVTLLGEARREAPVRTEPHPTKSTAPLNAERRTPSAVDGARSFSACRRHERSSLKTH